MAEEPIPKVIPLNAASTLPVSQVVSHLPENAGAANIISLAEELDSATRVQRSMLPRHYPSLKGWDVSGFCLAAGPIGGDFYDIQQLPGGRTLFVVADVMGKGIPAALIASVLRTVMRSVSVQSERCCDLLRRVNELIYEDLSAADMFVTVQTACLDPLNLTLTVASAGHCPLLMKRVDGEVESVSPAGIPIGVAPRAVYGEGTFDLEHISQFLLYTDGLIETRNPSGELLGLANLEGWLRDIKPSEAQGFESAESLKQEFLARLKAFERGLKPKDDQTFLLVSRK